MKCPNCGAVNPEGMKFCGECGGKLGASQESKSTSRTCVECGRSIAWDVNVCPHCGHSYFESRSAIGPPSSPIVPPSKGARGCVSCGRAIDWETKFCPYCGHDFEGRKMTRTPGGHAVAGGGLAILSGTFGLFLLFFVMWGLNGIPPGDILFSFRVTYLLPPALAIIGGAFGVARRYFWVALVGAVCALISLGFFFGIPAIILTATSKHQFK